MSIYRKKLVKADSKTLVLKNPDKIEFTRTKTALNFFRLKNIQICNDFSHNNPIYKDAKTIRSITVTGSKDNWRPQGNIYSLTPDIDEEKAYKADYKAKFIKIIITEEPHRQDNKEDYGCMSPYGDDDNIFTLTIHTSPQNIYNIIQAINSNTVAYLNIYSEIDCYRSHVMGKYHKDTILAEEHSRVSVPKIEVLSEFVDQSFKNLTINAYQSKLLRRLSMIALILFLILLKLI